MIPTPIWLIPSDENQPNIDEISNTYNICRPLASMLSNRNFSLPDIDHFLYPKLEDLSDPFQIPDVEKAVKRLWHAIGNREKILVFGDYDVDGVTSTTLMASILRKSGGMVDCYLPHRMQDGYGMSEETFTKAIDKHTLVVTVDCGITSHQAVEEANRRGIDVIITDHHQPDNCIPQAFAVINPKLHEKNKELQILAGVGVVFKFCHALLLYGQKHSLVERKLDIYEDLDLVALGTVADIVPLIGENRCLVKYGMERLSSQIRPGIRALAEISGVRDTLKVPDISYKLAPRINAAGRISSAVDALTLLQTESIIEAYEMAKLLDNHNQERKILEGSILRKAEEQIRTMDVSSPSIIVIGEDWHPGVVGIVASKLSNQYHRPTLVLTVRNGKEIDGSGRSIKGVNLVAILDSCREHLLHFGGHPMATGLALHPDNYPAFAKAFARAVKKACANGDTLVPKIHVDGMITLKDIDDDFFGDLDVIRPFGYGNSQPIFHFSSLHVQKMYTIGKQHSRGFVSDQNGNRIAFIAFGKKPNAFPRPPWDVLAIPELNTFNGKTTPQLRIIDARNTTN